MKGYRKSIQSNLVLLSVGTVGVLIILMMLITRVVSNIETKKHYIINSKSQMTILSNGIINYYKQIDSDINMMATDPLIKNVDNTITTYKDKEIKVDMTPSKNGGIEQKIYEVFDHYASTHPGTQYIYLATENGGYINWPETYITPNYDPTTREWYKLAVEAKGEIISTSPYIDENNNMVISNARAIYDNDGSLIGVVGIDVYQDVLSKLVSDVQVGDTGFYSIISKNGLILADGRNAENNLKSIKGDEFEKLLQDKSDVHNVKIDGEKYLVIPHVMEDENWIICFSVSAKQLNMITNRVNIIIGFVSVGLLIIMSYIILKGLRKIIIPIKESADYIIEIGKGNFNEDIKEEYLERDDEIGIITNGINDMRFSLMSLIYEIKNELMLFKKIADENKHSSILIYNEKGDIIYENNESLNINQYKNINFLHQDSRIELGLDKVNEIQISLSEKGFWSGTFDIKSTGETKDCTLQQIYNNENEKYTVVNIVDITEKVKSEKALLEYEKMKGHDQVRNEFFANISHELKTPLNIFTSTVQLLDLKNKEGSEELSKTYNKHKQCLAINCKRMLRLINNIVDITKIDVGFTKARFINCNIINIVEDVTLSVVNYAGAKEINVIFDTEIEELIIKCDVYMIERVILNLLSNAIKFTDQNGNILVKVFVDSKGVHITVKDDGIGVPEEFRESIFERFIQSDRSLNRLNEGSGIGLAIVSSLVRLNGGEVFLLDSEEKGTTFEVILPNEALNEGNDESQGYEVNLNNVEIELSDIYDLY
ncbi:MAG: cache domain-containing protein [Clostridium sp.]